MTGAHVGACSSLNVTVEVRRAEEGIAQSSKPVMVSAAASAVTVTPEPMVVPDRLIETLVDGRLARLIRLQMSIWGDAGFWRSLVAAWRAASREPWRTSRFVVNSQANSMMPKSNRIRRGAMMANSTRLAPRLPRSVFLRMMSEPAGVMISSLVR